MGGSLFGRICPAAWRTGNFSATIKIQPYVWLAFRHETADRRFVFIALCSGSSKLAALARHGRAQ